MKINVFASIFIHVFICSPFYGYHSKQHQFLKLYFYNPLIVKKACTLLQNGSILGKIYQPHEAHIPYILQFMIDYNLHGMSFVDLADIKYRVDPKKQIEYPENSTLPLSVQKMSVCKLEGDVQADFILNRLEITPGHLTGNPGIKALWEDEKQRLRNNDELSLVEHCLTQNRIDTPPTATHVAYKKILEEKLKMKSKNDDTSPESDLSVYPAETPPSLDLLDASMVEKHTPGSQDTEDSFLDVTIVDNPNETTLNEDAKNLYDLLEQMKDDNIEIDSILSQKQAEECISDQEDIDLSLPLNATLTPKKIETNSEDLQDFLNDSYRNTLGKIPQLDGTFDEDMEGEQILQQGKNYRQTSLFENNNFFAWCNEKNGIPFKKKNKITRIRTKRQSWKIRVKSLIPKARKRSRIACRNCSSNHGEDAQLCIKQLFIKIEKCDRTVTDNGKIKIERTESKVINDVTIIQNVSSSIKTEELDLLTQQLITNNNDEGFLNEDSNWFDMPLLCDTDQDIAPFNNYNNGTNVESNPAIFDTKIFPEGNNNNNDNASKSECNVKIVKKRGRKKKNCNNDVTGCSKTIMKKHTLAQFSILAAKTNIERNITNYNLRSNPKHTDFFTSSTSNAKGNSIKKIKSKIQSKNKNTQTKNTTMKTTSSIRKFKRGCEKPTLNIILSKKEGTGNDYDVKFVPIGKKSFKYYDLGPNPKVKFRIVPAYRPYIFKLKSNVVKYPNTTWERSDENYNVKTIAQTQNNSIIIKSNRVLTDNQKYDEMRLEKGKTVDVIKPNFVKIKENPQIPDITSEVMRSDYQEITQEEVISISPQIEQKYEEISCDIKEYNTNEDNNELSTPTTSQEECLYTLLDICEDFIPNNGLLGEDVEKIFNSIETGNEDEASFEYTDCANDNEEKHLNYPQEVANQYEKLMDKIGRSFEDLYESIEMVTEGKSISARKILENLRNDGNSKSYKSVSFNETYQIRSYVSDAFDGYSDNYVRIANLQGEWSESTTYKSIVQTRDRSVALAGKSTRRQQLKEITFETDANNNGKHNQVMNLNNTSQADVKILTFNADVPSSNSVYEIPDIVKNPLNLLSKDSNLNSLAPPASVSISGSEDVETIASCFTFVNPKNTEVGSIIAHQRKHSSKKRRSKFKNERKIETNYSSYNNLPIINNKIVKQPQTKQKLRFSNYIRDLEYTVGLQLNPTKVAINEYNDVDERVKNYELFKQNLERSHETQHAVGDNVCINGNVYCRLCYVKMRRYNFANSNRVVPLRDRLEFNNKRSITTNIRSATSLQRSHMVNYVADSNNNQSNCNIGLRYDVNGKFFSFKEIQGNFGNVIFFCSAHGSKSRSFLVNQQKYLDGTNDSSSSEDENITKPKPAKIQKMSKSSPRTESKYSPLQVQHRASPKKNSQTTFPKKSTY